MVGGEGNIIESLENTEFMLNREGISWIWSSPGIYGNWLCKRCYRASGDVIYICVMCVVLGMIVSFSFLARSYEAMYYVCKAMQFSLRISF